MDGPPDQLDGDRALPEVAVHRLLRRDVGVFGATMMGLGSIVGTGIFVSIGIAADAAGPSVIAAIAAAAIVAACNGLSSAQLAARHPVSGGTYEYGYRWLNSTLGFVAGWMFVCAKSASAATAALGCAGYVLNLARDGTSRGLVPVAGLIVLVLVAVTLAGIRRSSAVNIAIVSLTLASLLLFVLAGLPTAIRHQAEHLHPVASDVARGTQGMAGFLEACALMFVAYTGYGRIATLGEEIRDPTRNVPIAIGVTLTISAVLYIAVAFVAIAAVGAETLARASLQQAAPLEIAARQFDAPLVPVVVTIGAVTALIGVLLNLIVGLSRVVLAMARRGDVPQIFSRLDSTGTSPVPATLLVGGIVLALVSIGNVKTTWSFSAFTVLVYYALTNACALRLKQAERLYPAFISWIGLAACLWLAAWVDPKAWMTGLGLIAAGLIWHGLAGRFQRRSRRPT